MFIPGQIITAFTFPGVIVHEYAHVLFCKWRKIEILDVSYLNFSNDNSGYVIHEKTEKFADTFWVSMGPFIVNSILCFLLCFSVYLPLSYFDIPNQLYNFFLAWLGISIGMHAIPSNQDVSNVYNAAKEELGKGNYLVVLCYPMVLAVYIFNFLRFFWIDLIYALAVGFGIASLYFK